MDNKGTLKQQEGDPKTPLRILVFTQQFAAFRSGGGTYAYNLILGLLAKGHQITVVLPEGEELDIPGIHLIIIPKSKFDLTPGGWMTLARHFAKILHDEAKHHDLAHFTDAREALRIQSHTIPVTGMLNDSYALDWLEKDYPRKLFSDRISRSLYYTLLRHTEKRTYGRLEALLANSEHVARAVVSGYGLLPDHVEVIHYGLPEWKLPEPLPLDGSPSILFVGGNFQRKGLPLLLEAAGKLKTRFSGIRIHVVGKDRNQPAMEEAASRLRVRDALEFHGWQPNEKVRAMMAGADIFALPSLTEGFGLVYLEAMRVGTPVIATSIGGASEVFKDGEEALFVHPTDVDGLVQAIERIVSDRELAEKLRTGGYEAVKRFTVERMAERTEQVFQDVLERAQKGT